MEFAFTDAREPGKNDEATIKITDGGGNLDVFLIASHCTAPLDGFLKAFPGTDVPHEHRVSPKFLANLVSFP